MLIPYDFLKKQFLYQEAVSPSRIDAIMDMTQASAYIRPKFNHTENTIAGTRTSDTVFTRTAGTFTVNALIGKYVIALNADVSKVVYSIHQVASNTTTAITMATTFGDATLLASADTVLIYDSIDAIFNDVGWEQITS